MTRAFVPNEAGFGAFEAAVAEGEQALAERIAERMRANVAVRTGATRDSIAVDEVEGHPAVTVGEAGPYLEYGTADTPAQPFVYPSLVETLPEAAEVMGLRRG